MIINWPVYGVEDVVKLSHPRGFIESNTELSFQKKDHYGLREQKDDKHPKGSSNIMACVAAVGGWGKVLNACSGDLVGVPVGEAVEQAKEDTEEQDDGEHPCGIDQQRADDQDKLRHEGKEVLLLLLLDRHIAVGGGEESCDDRKYKEHDRHSRIEVDCGLSCDDGVVETKGFLVSRLIEKCLE